MKIVRGRKGTARKSMGAMDASSDILVVGIVGIRNHRKDQDRAVLEGSV
jgi:hypothetical protein